MELTFEKHTSEQSGPDGTHQQLTGAGAGSSAKRRKLDSGAALSIDNSEEAEASLIELEVKDLLADSAVDPHAEAAVLDLVNQVTELINSLPSAEVPPLSAKSFLKHLNFTPEKTFMFHPPTRIQPVGSFPLGAATLPSPALDLALEMPAACFDSKDQLNHRYHAKRALYLAHVAASLRGAAATSYASLCHDPRRPVLVLHPPPGASPSGLTIRIIPVPPPSAFPLQRLAPGRNNLRSAVVAPDTAAPTPPASAPDKQAKAGKGKASAAGKPGSKQAVQQGMEEGVAEAPTPHYNTSVLQDLLVLRQHSDSQAVASRCPRYAAACVLLKVWARCQAVDRGADGWGGPLLPWLLEDLLQKGTASCDMSAMNLFRATLVSLSNPRTFSGGLFMQRVQHTAGGGVAPPDSKAWRRHFPVVFVEASGWLNLAAHVSKAALAQVQQCAKASLQLLNAATPEAFEAVFRSPRPLTSLCDYWHHIRVAGEGEGRYKDALSQDQASWRSVESRIEGVVTQALGSRARWVRVFRREAAAPKSLKAGLPHPALQHVLVGVRVDPTAALRAVDVGPPADRAADAAAFRQFWGPRSELRRFQDGAICEAVVWECSAADRHLIPDRVVRYAVGRHLPPGTSVWGFAGAFDPALRRAAHVPQAYDVQTARLCQAATDRLCKQLRGLASVALRVVSTQPLSAASRHAAVFPPLPHLLAGAPHSALPPAPPSRRTPTLPRCLEPLEVLCQLEGSGKWPDNVAAFLKLKAALGVQLALELQAAYGVEAVAAEGGYVDVLSEGFAFRLVLGTERDTVMQQKALAMAQQTAVHPSLDLPLRAWHQGAVSGAAGANPAFEPSVRLAKRWVGAHLLSPHLAEEAVELLVVHCFACCAAEQGLPPPGSRTLGLLRFLRLLADHAWGVTPLIVDPEGEMSGEQREMVLRQHAARRSDGTAPAMYLATPRDSLCQGWTASRPSAPLLRRITVLAKRSVEALEGILTGCGLPSLLEGVPAPVMEEAGGGAGADGAQPPEGAEAAAAVLARVFVGEVGEYDAVIRLRREALPSWGRGGGVLPSAVGGTREPGKGAVLRQQADVTKHCRCILSGIPQSVVEARGQAAVRRELLVGFDPLPQFVEMLEERYGFLAVFCANYVCGDAVGVKWRAASFVPGPLKPEHAYALRVLGHAPPSELEHLGGEAGKRGMKRKGAAVAGHAVPAGLAVPDVAAIVDDIVAMGAGLVDSVEVRQVPTT